MARQAAEVQENGLRHAWNQKQPGRSVDAAGNLPEFFFHRPVGDRGPVGGFVLVADNLLAVTHRAGVGGGGEIFLVLGGAVVGGADDRVV